MLSKVHGSCKHLDVKLISKKIIWKVYPTKRNQTVCLHPDNRCNMVPHPLCKAGEDERDCKDEYKRKRKIVEYAHFECESPHHNNGSDTATVKIYTTACDGFEECYGGIDEINCEVSLPNHILFGELI